MESYVIFVARKERFKKKLSFRKTPRKFKHLKLIEDSWRLTKDDIDEFDSSCRSFLSTRAFSSALCLYFSRVIRRMFPADTAECRRLTRQNDDPSRKYVYTLHINKLKQFSWANL